MCIYSIEKQPKVANMWGSLKVGSASGSVCETMLPTMCVAYKFAEYIYVERLPFRGASRSVIRIKFVYFGSGLVLNEPVKEHRIVDEVLCLEWCQHDGLEFCPTSWKRGEQSQLYDSNPQIDALPRREKVGSTIQFRHLWATHWRAVAGKECLFPTTSALTPNSLACRHL